MGLTVYWTQFAEDKLEDIYTYYKFNAGSKIAERLVNGIINVTLELDKNPYIGQAEEFLAERLQAFRYIIHQNYKIIYWIDELNEMILVSNVFDTRQNPVKLNRTP